MNIKHFKAETALQVGKPLRIVFEAIVDPQQMKQYFISESSGRMEAGKEIMWKFPEFEQHFPVQVIEAEQDELVSFSWEIEQRRHLVRILLKPSGAHATVVTVTETGAEPDEKGVAWLVQNTSGWANFLACMKAYLEYGINLRKGAFDFMRKSNS